MSAGGLGSAEVFDHVVEKFREAQFFLHAMTETQKQHTDFARKTLRVFEGQGNNHGNFFRYFTSAFLSAHRSTRYYMIRQSGKVKGSRSWREAIEANPILRAFTLVRDADIHDGMLNGTVSVTVTPNADGTAAVDVSDIKLHYDSLARLARFKSDLNLAKYLSERPFVEIAKDGLDELAKVIADGKTRGFL